jgi:hypothetical protein
VLASVRIEYHLRGGDTIVDEIETDALRCTTRSCRYAFLDLATLMLDRIETSLPRRTSVQIPA